MSGQFSAPSPTEARRPVITKSPLRASPRLLGPILLTALCLQAAAQAQEFEDDGVPSSDLAPASEVAPSGLQNQPGPLPRNAFRSDPAIGVPYRSLFRNDRIQPMRADAAFNADFPGEGSETVRTGVELPGVNVNFRVNAVHDMNILARGFEPNDADLKVGPLYFKLRALSGAILATDNAFLTPENRESGAIAIAALSGTVVAQLTEGLRLAASGSIIWLPFKGEFGFVSNSGIFHFGLSDSYDSRLAQLSIDGKIGEWEYRITDSFDVIFPNNFFFPWTGNFRDDAYEGSNFAEYDQIGRYRYGGGGLRSAEYDGEYRENNRDSEFSVDDAVYVNRVEALAQRVYPGSIRLRLRAFREDLWYNQGHRGLPRIREGFGAFARAESEDLRFKPFINYSASRNDDEGEFSQVITTGFDGPITDQLTIRAYAGVYLPANTDSSHLLAGLSLNHIAGPYTTESLFIGREVDDSFREEEIVDRVGYGLHQILGPRLSARAYASYAIFRPSTDLDVEREEYRAGLLLSYFPGVKTDITLGYSYSYFITNSPEFLFPGERDDDEERNSTSATRHTLQLSIGYQFTDTLEARLLYRYQQLDTDDEDEGYYENLGIFSLTKYFR